MKKATSHNGRGGYRPNAGRKQTGKVTLQLRVTPNEKETLKEIFAEKVGNMTQSKYYEQVGDGLTGDAQIRAYHAAQSHIPVGEGFLAEYKRLQLKIVAALDAE